MAGAPDVPQPSTAGAGRIGNLIARLVIPYLGHPPGSRRLRRGGGANFSHSEIDGLARYRSSGPAALNYKIGIIPPIGSTMIAATCAYVPIWGVDGHRQVANAIAPFSDRTMLLRQTIASIEEHDGRKICLRRGTGLHAWVSMPTAAGAGFAQLMDRTGKNVGTATFAKQPV